MMMAVNDLTLLQSEWTGHRSKLVEKAAWEKIYFDQGQKIQGWASNYPKHMVA